MADFTELIKRARNVRQLYTEYETGMYGRNWSREELMLGFIGDVGDLSKLVLANEGVRNIEDARDKLAHELSDCLWSIMILADSYDIDLEQSFTETMQELEDHLGS